MEIEIDLSEVLFLVGRIQQGPAIAKEETTTAVRQAGFLLQRDAQNEAPVDTGHLKNTIGPPVTTEMVTRVSTHADYAKPVHDGAKPHVIVPTSRKALYWPGAAHPVRRVNHPGNAANPFMVRGLTKAMPDIIRLFEKAGQRIGQRILGG